MPVLTSLPTECLRLIAKATARADPVSVFRLAASCSQFRRILEPSDVALWKQMVLTSFDFTATPSATVNKLQVYIEIEDEDIEQAVEMFGDDFDESKVDRDAEEPPYLLEPLSTWKSICDRGIAFRASQFGFLSQIQATGSQVDKWPENEDPFTLFKDLIFLSTNVPAGFEENCRTSEGDGEMFPVLLPQVSSSGETDRPGLLMKTIGIHPNVWGRVEKVPFPTNRDREMLKSDDAEYGVSSTDPVFKGMVEEFLCVHPNKGSDGGSPFFCLGKSKSSGRYLGVCGEVVWT